jgi:hypothetical protein
VTLGRRLVLADEQQEQRRAEKADRVEQDRNRRLQHGDQRAADAGPGDLRRRPARLQLRVALVDLVAVDERWQVGLVRDVEEHRHHAHDEADHVQLPDGQHAEQECDGDRQERGRTAQVREDQDRAPAQAIDPSSGGQADQHEWQELDRAEQRELERLDLEHDRRDERDREERDLGAELTDRLGCPQVSEVAVTDERLPGSGHGHRSSLAADGLTPERREANTRTGLCVNASRSARVASDRSAAVPSVPRARPPSPVRAG